MYYIGICDEEKRTCAQLEEYLYTYGEKNSIRMDISVWYTGESLCNSLSRDDNLDMLFLESNMSNSDGMKVGLFIREKLNDFKMDIAYVSSAKSCSMNLFKMQPMDFLIKPLARGSVEEAVARSLKIHSIRKELFEFHTKDGYFKIPFEDILYFYSRNKEVNIVMEDKEKNFCGRLKNVQKVVPDFFLMIHQSYLVNKNFIVEYSYQEVTMKNGVSLNISQPYRRYVKEQFQVNSFGC